VKLPNHEQAIIPRAKITDYLLSLSHPDGRGKARFFASFGFSIEAWEILAEALLRHAADREVTRIGTSPFGTRYVIERIISTPGGGAPLICAVWFIETSEDIPRFATAYLSPIRTSCNH
jgi:hypothetical protein